MSTKTLFLGFIAGLLASSAIAAEPPFTGAVTGDDVYIRSGPGDNYYQVSKLGKGDIVRVTEVLYTWYRIDPPAGSFSYIAKEFIKPDATGKLGVVSGENVRVRAPSPAGPSESYRVQLRLNAGDPVTILGEEGDFYRIAPPPGVQLFISKDFVAQASAEQIAAWQARQKGPGPVTPPVAPVVAPVDPVAPPTPPVPPVEPVVPPVPPVDPVNPVEPVDPFTPPVPPADPAPPVERGTPQLIELEQRWKDISALPLADQPLTDLRLAYTQLLAVESLAPLDKALIEARLQLIENRRELQIKLTEIATYKQQLDAARVERDQAEARKPKVYLAVGRLGASSLYTGEKLPLLYRLVDPLSNLTIAYIEPAGVDLKKDVALLLGQYVGVAGEKQYDPALKLQVIRATAIDELQPQQP